MMPEEAAVFSTMGLIEKSHYLSTVNRYKKPIVLELRKGIGSRIKALASGICAAKELDKEVYVTWPFDSNCGAKFSDLFEDVSGVRVHDKLSVGYQQQICDTQEQWDAVKGGNSVIFLKSSSRFHTTDEEDFVNTVKSLVPSVNCPLDLSGTVGVHVRGSPTAIIAAMQDISSNFFVASDSDENRKAIEAAFPGRVKTLATSLARDVAGMQDALRDFLALSKCSRIIATKSSFSEMAALYGGVPLTVPVSA